MLADGFRVLRVQRVRGLFPVALRLPGLRVLSGLRTGSPDKAWEKSLRAFSKLAALLGPAASLLAEGEAQTMAFGNPHPAIAQF